MAWLKKKIGSRKVEIMKNNESTKILVEGNAVDISDNLIKKARLSRTRIDLINNICRLLVSGYYDDLMKGHQKDKSIYIDKAISQEAREYVREYGYNRLGDALAEILEYENQHDIFEFDKAVFNLD